MGRRVARWNFSNLLGRIRRGRNYSKKEKFKTDTFDAKRREYLEANPGEKEIKVIKFNHEGTLYDYHANTWNTLHKQMKAEQELMDGLITSILRGSDKTSTVDPEKRKQPKRITQKEVRDEFIATGNISDENVVSAAKYIVIR